MTFLRGYLHPEFLWFALVPAALLVLNWLRPRAGRETILFSAYDWIPRESRPPTGRTRHLLRFASTLALVPLVAGISAGRVQISETRVPAAWMIVLDISSSMTAEDFKPGRRLDVAKVHLRELLTRAPETYVGLVLFAASPRLLVPLTLEREAVLEALQQAREAGYGEDGTAIGSALASAVNRLREGPWGERNILLITDGVNNRGSVAPLDASLLARTTGVSIHAIGMGTDEVTRYWVPLESGETRELRARIEIDDEALVALSRESGGSYRRVRTPGELRAHLGTLIRDETVSREVVESATDYTWIHLLAWAAIVCLMLEFAICRFLLPELPD